MEALMSLGAFLANTFVIETINHWSAALGTPLVIPTFTDYTFTVAAGLYMFVAVVRNRETIFGGFRAPLEVTPPPEAAEDWKPTEFLQNPSIKDPNNKDIIRLFDPTDGAVLGNGSVKVDSDADVQEAVNKARVAQKDWVKTSFAQRGEVLKLLNDYVVSNQALICRVASRDTGKTMVDGGFGEVLTTCEKISWTLKHGEAALAPDFRPVGMLTIHKTASVEYQPMGVLGAIIPWNYPFHNMLGQVISAIFSGNAIVLKVSEHTCWSSIFFADVVKKALARYGHSEDLIQVVNGYGMTGASLIPKVDKLVFIGSPEVGKLVMKSASDTLTPVVLELGGKDAAVVCDDCDMEQVITLAMRGTYQNCGQNCIGLERLVVNEKIYDGFVATMEAKVKALSQGPPLTGDFDCGAMTMGPDEIKRICGLVERSVAQGARLVTGGKRNADFPKGSFMEPTLLVDVTRDMEIAQNEVFGPVMTIMKAKDDADAVAIVNSTRYGLGSSVFSLDYGRAGAIAQQLRTGMTNLNDFGVNYLCQSLPFGGVNASGFDRFAGIEGIRGCCNMRAVTSDKVTGVRTNIPPPLQYPIAGAGFDFVASLMNMFYGDGLLASAMGVATLIKASVAKKPSPKSD